MIPHDDQLLISAYIDGEVTPDEKVRAEQLLVDDANARAFRKELLSMSAGLKSLPQHTLPADFADDVLAAAEREMFTGEPWPGDADTEAPSIATRIFNSRTIAYAGATIAAALLVALFLPNGALDNNANENVAHKPEDIEDNKTPSSTAEVKQPLGDQSTESKPSVVKKDEVADENPFPVVKPERGAEHSGKTSPRSDVKDRADYFGGKGEGSWREPKGGGSPKVPAAAQPKNISPKDDKLPGSPQPRSLLELAEKIGVKQSDSFAAEAPKGIFAASYNVSVADYGAGFAGGQRHAATESKQSIEEQVFQHARRKLAKRGVTWPDMKKKLAAGAAAQGVPAEEHVRAVESLKTDRTKQPTPTSDRPVVVYLEATEAQAMTLLAALDSDPYFSRVRQAANTGSERAADPFAPEVAATQQLNGIPGDARDLATQKKALKSKRNRGPKLKAYRLSRAETTQQSEEGGLVQALDGAQSGGAGGTGVGESDKKEADKSKGGGDKSPHPKRANSGPETAVAKPNSAQAMTGRLVVVFRLIDEPQDASAAAEPTETAPAAGSPAPAAVPPGSSDAKPGE